MDDCWFCDDNRGDDVPPGGWLTTRDGWRAGHVPSGWGPDGTVVIESVAHAESFACVSDDHAAGFTRLLGRTQDAIRAATGADRAYVWATMDRHPHLHAWVVPWWVSKPLRGPAYLADVLTFQERAAVDTGSAASTAHRLRELLES